MYNAREAASGDTVAEIQNFYKEVFPKIQSYQGEVWAEKKKNARVIGVPEKILNWTFNLAMIGAIGTLIYFFFYSISNVKDSFTLSMIILGILIGGPIALFTAFFLFLNTKPEDKPISVKFPLKKEEQEFMNLIKKFSSEHGSGTKLSIYVNTALASLSFKEPLPEQMLFRGDNDDASKRSFVFEVKEDEIKILLPDEAGVYKYANKPGKSSGEGLPNANFPQQVGDGLAIIDNTF